ncbi:uncharacterized skeletal organic matrix protein 5-like [Stylophora pistillata]|uniref:uncharacterized skeletal organic matrix protein 5-like n=1 Tax=Stylophora pistillata TaxID=50429 RepID=UPI000C03E330|nr:uncharacterized skeletal organic matrix protein 5-like [Stylophora pistillata]
MYSVYTWILLIVQFSMITRTVRSQEFFEAGRCRTLEFRPESAFDGKRLMNHVIRIVDVMVKDFCETMCYLEPDCISINLGKRADGHGVYKCELNNVTHEGHEDKLKDNESYSYSAAESACAKSPCKNNASCRSGYTDVGDHCLCPVGFSGRACEKGPTTCKEAHEKNLIKESTLVTLLLDSKPVSLLCYMGDFGCGAGGWTPVMKIDGKKGTFHFNKPYWTDKNNYNPSGGETGFDDKETKLPSYWNTSFSKICLGMKIGNQTNFIVINKQADSLYSLIADGKYRETSLGRDKWKEILGANASLQTNCNKEGFNVVCEAKDSPKARIGIVSNQQNDCYTCNSRIGFGTGGPPDNSNTCGNEANSFSPDNGIKQIKAMGYILVQ